MKFPLFIAIFIVAFWGFTLLTPEHESVAKSQPTYLWKIRSIDTMKTSRDMARDILTDGELEKELQTIKNLGANYVAIDTPYDEEFLPLLKRWVIFARRTGLKVWFRGNWSSWEGWFDYPKNMTPEEHNQETAKFIETNPDLFEDGDIFDPCSECENSGFWKQPEDNAEYNQFIQDQRKVVKDSFSKIKKRVYTNIFSINGGRAKEVLSKKTLDTLDNVVTIDHYFKDPSSMSQYIDYFSQNYHTTVLVGEFGAPIPDINGSMNENEQAQFINEVFKIMYKDKENVLGINYNVLTGGTTSLLNEDGTPREATEIIKNYFIPGGISGTVTNTVGDRLPNIKVKTSDELNSTTTDSLGRYTLTVPANAVDEIIIKDNKYKTISKKETFNRGTKITRDFILEPRTINLTYRIRLIIKYIGDYISKITR